MNPDADDLVTRLDALEDIGLEGGTAAYAFGASVLIPELRERLTAAEAERDEAVAALRLETDRWNSSPPYAETRAFLARLRDRST